MFKSLVITLMACFGSSSSSIYYDHVEELKQNHYQAQYLDNGVVSFDEAPVMTNQVVFDITLGQNLTLFPTFEEYDYFARTNNLNNVNNPNYDILNYNFDFKKGSLTYTVSFIHHPVSTGRYYYISLRQGFTQLVYLQLKENESWNVYYYSYVGEWDYDSILTLNIGHDNFFSNIACRTGYYNESMDSWSYADMTDSVKTLFFKLFYCKFSQYKFGGLNVDLSNKNFISYFNTESVFNTFFIYNGTHTNPFYLYKGYFYCNNMLFDSIKLMLIHDLSNTDFIYNGNTYSGGLAYGSIGAFIQSISFHCPNGDSYVVWLNDWSTTIDDYTSTTYLVANSGHFISSEYKQIQLLSVDIFNGSNDLTLIRNGTNYIDVISYTASVSNSGVPNGTPVYWGGNDPLTLLSSGFVAFTSLFGIAILPGITVGVLLFIPLVATIILAIIKVLKK